jgi:hypothetical protein
MARLNRAAKLLDREKALEARAAERQGRTEAPAGAVSAYRARVAALTDCHRIPYAPKDWAAVAAKGLVDNPVRTNVNGAAARRALLSYRPTFWDRLFGLDQDRRRLLNARVAQEESKDEAAYRAAYKAAAEHNAEVEFAMKLVALDLRAVRASLAKNTTIGEIGPAIEGYDLTVPARGRLAVTIAGLEQDDMPDERCEIGDDGKGVYQPLSRAAMSGLHRANICSAALRVGAELLSAAPVATVEGALLGSTPVPTVTLAPTAENAQVVIMRVLNPGDVTSEGVEIRNLGGLVDLEGWTLYDTQGNIFTFPDYRLFPNAGVTVYTRVGSDTPVALFWDETRSVWSNGDVASLANAAGVVQSTFRVGVDGAATVPPATQPPS